MECKIEKLFRCSSSPDGYIWIQHPTNEDLMNKINEIIDYINNMEKVGTNAE